MHNLQVFAYNSAEIETGMPKTKHRARGLKCPTCRTALQPDAKFCHKCGAPTRGKRDVMQWDRRNITLVGVMITLSTAGLAIVLSNVTTDPRDLPSPPRSDIASSPARPGQPVDLSTMSPRQAADRLFNRVMSAEQRGDTAQVEQFGPMALQAYQLVDRLDSDAHFHIGLIALALGDLDEVRKQVGKLEQDSTDHLLGLALAHEVAKRDGDEQSASDILARFAAAYDAEIGTGKPEYQAHRYTIDRLRALTAGLTR